MYDAANQTQIDHAAYARKVREMTEPQLRFVISDCKEALAAMPNGHKAGYYQDEICYCASELHSRKLNK